MITHTVTNEFSPLLAMAVQKGAKEGRIRTREGLPARVVCTDLAGSFPVIALIAAGGEEMINIYTTDGHYFLSRRECGSDLVIDTVEAIDPQAGAVQPAPGMKRCARCGEWKPLAEFGTESRLKDKKRPYCHECVSLMGKEYRQRARQAKDGKKTIG